jgi:hypothetical protein
MTTTTSPAPSRADHDGEIPEWTQGDRLRKSLRHADIAVGAMAEMLDVSPATIGRWLNDKGPMRRVYRQVWADLTGVSTHWLETGEYAMRDLNPQPADSVSLSPRTQRHLALVHSVAFPQDSVKVAFTPNLRSVS